jgi:alpha-beta hydrolase superfamily lysophospholipase
MRGALVPCAWALLWVLALALCLLCVVQACEDRLLLHPAGCARYRFYAGRERVPLPGGGQLIRLPSEMPDARAVLCLHGNGGNADGLAFIAAALADRGYEVLVLENRGYGECARRSGTAAPPTMAGFAQDLLEAWRWLGQKRRASAILLGVSLGGGSIGQLLAHDEVTAEDMPEQVVLINTFADLPTVVRDVVPVLGPAFAALMRAQWDTRPGLKRYCRLVAGRAHHAPGNILVVGTADDALTPLKHSIALVGADAPAQTRRLFAVLPNGGHNAAIERHAALWLPLLLPPSACKT